MCRGPWSARSAWPSMMRKISSSENSPPRRWAMRVRSGTGTFRSGATGPVPRASAPWQAAQDTLYMASPVPACWRGASPDAQADKCTASANQMRLRAIDPVMRMHAGRNSAAPEFASLRSDLWKLLSAFESSNCPQHPCGLFSPERLLRGRAASRASVSRSNLRSSVVRHRDA